MSSPRVLARLRQVIQGTILPTWATSPRPKFGSADAGTPKADDWRSIISIHLPITLISLYGLGSSLKDDPAFHEILDHTMQLVCAVLVACKRITTPRRISKYRSYMQSYISRLTTIYPGLEYQSIHHLAFHIYDSLKLFGPVHSWWCFPFERLIGLLQRLPQNHKSGKFL